MVGFDSIEIIFGQYVKNIRLIGRVPVGTLTIGKAGAINAALLAGAILANSYPGIGDSLDHYRILQTQKILDNNKPNSQSL